MYIENHLLKSEQEDKLTYISSPNTGEEFSEVENGHLDSIIVHHTGQGDVDSAVKHLCDPNLHISSHIIVGRDGSIVQLVPFDQVAFHAGKGTYKNRTRWNQYSIGISLDNAGILHKEHDSYVSWFGKAYSEKEVLSFQHKSGKVEYWQSFSETQIYALEKICRLLIEKYSITHLYGYGELAPHKQDPGPAISMPTLRERLFEGYGKEDANHFVETTESSEEAKEYIEHFEDENEFDEDPTPFGSLPYGTVLARKLNVRSNPSFKSEKASEPLIEGDTVKIIGEQDDWYQIELNSPAWVHKDYIHKYLI